METWNLEKLTCVNLQCKKIRSTCDGNPPHNLYTWYLWFIQHGSDSFIYPEKIQIVGVSRKWKTRGCLCSNYGWSRAVMESITGRGRDKTYQ